MSSNDLDAVLEKMGRIATAVNSFQSEAVQQLAFAELLRIGIGSSPTALGSPGAVAKLPPKDQAKAKRDGGGSKERAGQEGARRRAASTAKSGWTFDRTLDLRPAGKQSFAEFVAEKQPKSNEDRFASIVYYFAEVVGKTPVTVDHIGSVFRLIPDWREPTNLPKRLSVASSRKGTLVTRDLNDIQLTTHGRNFVEHDLPPKKAA